VEGDQVRESGLTLSQRIRIRTDPVLPFSVVSLRSFFVAGAMRRLEGAGGTAAVLGLQGLLRLYVG